MAALFKAMLGGIQDIGNAGLVWTGRPTGLLSGSRWGHALTAWSYCTGLIIDLDAKPANVLWSDVDGPSPIIKIADLGLGIHNFLSLYVKHTG